MQWGTGRKPNAWGRVLATGPLSLIRIDLTPREYDKQIRGSEPYLYVVARDSEEYQLDLFNTVGGPGNYRVSERYRNVMAYLAADCMEAVQLAKGAGFDDAALLRVVGQINSCSAAAGEGSYAVAVDPPSKNYHSTAISVLRLGGDEVVNTGLSASFGYLGEYGFRRSGHFRLLVGVGVNRMRYRTRYEEDIRQMMLYGKLMVAYGFLPEGKISPQLGLGYSIYNNLGGGDSGRAIARGQLGYTTLQAAVLLTRVVFFADIQVDLSGRSGHRPDRLLELGMRYRY